MGFSRWFAPVAAALGVVGCRDVPSVRPFMTDVVRQGSGAVFRGTFSSAGDEFYFFRQVGPGEDYRVFRTTVEDGTWGPPERLDLGDADASTFYPAVSPDGRALVVASYRATPAGDRSANLWMLTRDGRDWVEPVLLAALSTSGNYDASPRFDGAGRLRFTSTTADGDATWFRRSASATPPYGMWVTDSLWEGLAASVGGHRLWSGVLAPDGRVVVAEVSDRLADGSWGPSDLWMARKTDSAWGVLTPIGGDVNTAGTENFPAFTPDGSQLVFVRDFAGFHVIATRLAHPR